VVTHWRNHPKFVSHNNFVLAKPNWIQNNIWKRTSKLLHDIPSLNVRYISPRVVLITRMRSDLVDIAVEYGYRRQDRRHPKFVSTNQGKTRVQAVSMSYLLYRTRDWVVRAEQDILWSQITYLSIQFHSQPSMHCLCPNMPSESSLMIRLTTNTT